MSPNSGLQGANATLDKALLQAPGVAEVVVFGVPDERWGQRVCAAVVPGASWGLPPGSADHRSLVDSVADYASTRLAAYKRPKTWVVLEDLPRTATGKPLHRVHAEDGGAPTGAQVSNP